MTTEWSPSRLQLMLDCGEAYRRVYITRDGKRQDSAATLLGKSVHWSLQLATDAMIAGGQVIDGPFGIENAVQHFEGLVASDRESDDPIPWEEGQLDARTAELKRMTRMILDRVPDVWLEYGQPIMSEWDFHAVPFRGYLLRGQVDAATETAIIDWKSGSKAMGQYKANLSFQRLVYSAAYQERYGRFPELFLFFQVTRPRSPKGNFHVNAYPVPQREEELDVLEQLLERASYIEAMGAYQYNPQSWMHSPDFCPFWNSCPMAKFGPPRDEPPDPSPGNTDTV
jgi:hypothetical protein